jgi:hypothetical protein
MKYHGHKLLEEHILKQTDLKGKVIIEVGSVREHLQGQNSTGFFMKLCKEHDMKLISVDMDPECTDNVHKEAEKINFKNYEAVTMKGEDYLESIESFDYLYLDGFDFYHNHHSEKRQEKYKNILNTEITDEGSWKSHLDMVTAVYKKGGKDSLICIDDVFTVGAETKGKGCTAIPFLLQNGWTSIEKNYNAEIFLTEG